MFLKNEDVKIGTIPDANGSDNPLKKMEFLTEKEMKYSSRLFGKVIVPPGSALAYHTHEGEGEAYHILQGKGLYIMTMVQNMKYIQEILHSHVMELDMLLRISETKILYLWH